MTGSSDATKALTKLFSRDVVQDLDALFEVLGTSSRMTVFRRLREVGYLSSYTHAGRYYTLRGLPDFDQDGLWVHRGIGFSRAGTLKQTVAVLVHEAEVGRTHAELESRLRVRVHNALLGLVREQSIARECVGGPFVYLSADPERRAMQLANRRALSVGEPVTRSPVPTELVIAVLVETLHASRGLAPSAVVAARLTSRGESVTPEQVEQVYSEHGLVTGKKTVEPP
jgi:hypothetical protein